MTVARRSDTDEHEFIFFALFLQSHPLPAQETLAGIAADEAPGDAWFAAVRDDEWAALVASVEAKIREGNMLHHY